jgi:hypothetical protein
MECNLLNSKLDDANVLAKSMNASTKEKDLIIESLLKEVQMLKQNMDILNVEVNKLAKSHKSNV